MTASGGKADVDNDSRSVSESSAPFPFFQKKIGKRPFLKLQLRDRRGEYIIHTEWICPLPAASIWGPRCIVLFDQWRSRLHTFGAKVDSQ